MGKMRSERLDEVVVAKSSSPTYPHSSKASLTAGDDRIRLRYLCPADIPAVKSLCAEIFPIEYPEYWYNEIATNPGYYSLAAVFADSSGAQVLIGVLIAEVKRLSVCSTEDRDMMAKCFPANTAVAYILSLGVTKRWRRVGIASRLLDHLLAYVGNGVGTSQGEVKAVYLHVLCENRPAIRFYEQRHFRRHKRLAHYYQIRSTPRDGYTYVLHVNGGRASEGPLECVRSVGRCSVWLWSLLLFLLSRPLAGLRALRHSLARRLRSSAPAFRRLDC